MAFATQPVDLSSGQIYRTPPAPTYSVNNTITPTAQTKTTTPTPTPTTARSSFDNIIRANPDLLSILQRGGAGGGNLGGNEAGGNPNGGQPGSAGDPGLAKSAADALMGLAMGLGPLGIAGSVLGKVGGFASESPNVLGELLGLSADNPQGLSASAVTDAKTIENMGINPSAYGLTQGPVGQMTSNESPQQQAAQQAALDAAAQAGNQGATASNNDPAGGFAQGGGGQPGTGQGDAPGGAPGGVSGGDSGAGPGDSTGGGTGAAGGETAKGGPVKGPPPKHKDDDNLRVSETGQGLQAGEHVMNRQAVKVVGRRVFDEINRLARQKDRKEAERRIRRLFADAA